MEKQLKLKINGRNMPTPMYRYIIRSSVLQISGFEFDAAIYVSTEWEDYMGGNWKRLRTKDLNGGEHILEMDFDAKTISIIHTYTPEEILKEEIPDDLKSMAMGYAFNEDLDNPTCILIMNELKTRLSEQEYNEFVLSLQFPY